MGEDRWIAVTVEDDVADVVIDRREKRNALNLAMWERLEEVFADLSLRRDVRVAVLRGTDGTSFSAGADIAEFAQHRGNPEAAKRYDAAMHRAVRAIQAVPYPTVAVLAGYCLGGGTQLAIACDLRFADASLQLGIPPARLGVVYPVEHTAMLIDLVGPSRAKDLIYSARLLTAQEAYAIGLVDRLWPVGDLLPGARAAVRQMADNAPNTLAGAKVMVGALTSRAGLGQQELQRLVQDSVTSAEYREGIRAFMEKRPPRFRTVDQQVPGRGWQQNAPGSKPAVNNPSDETNTAD
ncbi:MAG: enoyl-CoA hydratase-related protein [Thermaerobacter sp.]|nr:enoyl-CoA hydratase-related protein [Thermaerobacter sp.]